MSATDPLVAQKAYSTDLRYQERMARVIEGRGRILIMLALVCLALAVARAADLGSFGVLKLDDSLAVVEGSAFAPDQYRVLPHLIMVGLARLIGFKPALEVFTFGFLLAFLWMAMFVAWQDRPAAERAACCVFVAMLYPLSMFAGARFDTALHLAFMLGGLCLWHRPALYLPLIVLLSLARADYALILALFVLVQVRETGRPPLLYGFACCIPLMVQAAMWTAFPDATYYTTVLQISGNITGDVLRMPGFLYSLGVAALVAAYARPSLRLDRYAIAKLAVLALYILLILLVARAREWRLWLPLLPLVYGLFCGPALNGRTK